MPSSMQYVCGACGYHRPRLRSVQDHCRTKKAAASHPLGDQTEITRRMMPSHCECDCVACGDDAADEEMQKDADRSVCVAEFTRLLKELNVAASALGRWKPAHQFLREPIPAAKGLKAKLLDIFAGNVVAHLTWTHVWSCGNVRGSSRQGHLRVYGPHGWTSRLATDVSRAAVEAFPARLERMWLSLDAADETSLRRAMRAFADTRTVPMVECQFGVSSTPTVAGTAALVRELAAAFEEYCEK
jgi:hypothetical protein